MILLELNNFGPFHADIWGSVSDWAMVMATIVTAWLLLSTLKEQQKISRIEQARFIEGIKPIYQLEIINKKINNSKQAYSVLATFILKNEGGSAKNVTVNIKHARTEWRFFNSSPNDLKFPYKSYILPTFAAKGVFAGLHCSDANFTFTLVFSDHLNVAVYRQSIHCIFNKDDIEFQVSPVVAMETSADKLRSRLNI